MNGEQLGRALAYATGDLRDWPMQCGWCTSEDLFLDHANDRLHCRDCHHLTTLHVAQELRVQRARREVVGYEEGRMTAPTYTERMRGTSEGRHPWFPLLSTGGPPDLPPETLVTGSWGEEPPNEDQCPKCRYAKVGICGCGYDWENYCWLEGRRE